MIRPNVSIISDVEEPHRSVEERTLFKKYPTSANTLLPEMAPSLNGGSYYILDNDTFESVEEAILFADMRDRGGLGAPTAAQSTGVGGSALDRDPVEAEDDADHSDHSFELSKPNVSNTSKISEPSMGTLLRGVATEGSEVSKSVPVPVLPVQGGGVWRAKRRTSVLGLFPESPPTAVASSSDQPIISKLPPASSTGPNSEASVPEEQEPCDTVTDLSSPSSVSKEL
ncbi:hypothetical protein TREMEDRAFT_63113 [Tremella mesenterica DSM 1558]|uniref:uncharacterized protein n=1 Tax=Tremella mesenterica (strain ATCC 24925 / CBS 8224 / DSM 1558 / NBRC 9311 / NRRL Y-6157 / RJB 2259-6 / UBC 559-6) TaxID=578456 RepID=UPI0003F48DEF|nr:uncharacterized protein TREMEDRAFT_63113 [Tremella mesenterica DSM 1558]EIW68646.1 hypothetical protein TREMEDRAFT_63113 [Tremella mesenterica DSM 1558]